MTMFLLTVHVNKCILCWKFNLIFFIHCDHNLCFLGAKHGFLLVCSTLCVDSIRALLPPVFVVLLCVLQRFVQCVSFGTAPQVLLWDSSAVVCSRSPACCGKLCYAGFVTRTVLFLHHCSNSRCIATLFISFPLLSHGFPMVCPRLPLQTLVLLSSYCNWIAAFFIQQQQLKSEHSLIRSGLSDEWHPWCPLSVESYVLRAAAVAGSNWAAPRALFVCGLLHDHN